MRRSIGVTINAAVLLAASAAGFIRLVVLLILGITDSLKNPDTDNVAAITVFIFIAVMMGVACLGFATGIGLLRLRTWARTFSVVVSALLCLVTLLFFVLFGAVMTLAWHEPGRGAIPDGLIVRGLIWVTAATYCGWWAYYFQTRSVKEQFGIKEYVRPAIPIAPVQTRPVGPVILPALPETTAKHSGRPVGITIVAAIFLTGAGGALFSLPSYAIFHTPAPFFGTLLSGWIAPVLTLAMGGLSAAAGIGLIKMKLWARTLGIYFLAFGFVNSLVTLLRPGSIARLEESMLAAQLQFMPNQPGTENFQAAAYAMFHAWFRLVIPASLIIGGGIAVVEIWLLVTRKQAFIDANQSSDINS